MAKTTSDESLTGWGIGLVDPLKYMGVALPNRLTAENRQFTLRLPSRDLTVVPGHCASYLRRYDRWPLLPDWSLVFICPIICADTCWALGSFHLIAVDRSAIKLKLPYYLREHTKTDKNSEIDFKNPNKEHLIPFHTMCRFVPKAIIIFH